MRNFNERSFDENGIESDFENCLNRPNKKNIDKFLKTHRNSLDFLLKKVAEDTWETRYTAALLIYHGHDNSKVVEPIINSLRKYKNFEDRVGYIFAKILSRYKNQRVSEFASEVVKKIKHTQLKENWRSFL